MLQRQNERRRQQQQLEQQSMLHKTVLSATSSSSSRSYWPPLRNDETPVEKEASLLKVGMSFALLCVLDHGFKIVLRGVQFPASLAGMIILWTALLGTDAVSPAASAFAMRWLAPGAGLLAAWLPLFFAPSLVNLPLSAFRPKGNELAKLTVVVVGGFFASLAGTALLAAQLVGLKSTSAKEKGLSGISFPLGSGPALGRSDRGDAVAKAAEANIPRPSDYWALPVSAAITAAGAAAVAVEALSQATTAASTTAQGAKAATAAPLLTGATFLGFTAGVALKSPILHPVLLCAVATVAAAQFAAQALGLPLTTILGGGGYPAGALLLALLGPSVLSFAVPMYSRRRLMKQEFTACAFAPLVGAFGGLFGTALVSEVTLY